MIILCTLDPMIVHPNQSAILDPYWNKKSKYNFSNYSKGLGFESPFGKLQCKVLSVYNTLILTPEGTKLELRN